MTVIDPCESSTITPNGDIDDFTYILFEEEEIYFPEFTSDVDDLYCGEMIYEISGSPLAEPIF